MSSKSGTTTIANFASTDCTSEKFGSTAPSWSPSAGARQFNFPVTQNGGGKITKGAGFSSVTAFCTPVTWNDNKTGDTTSTPNGGGSWVPGNIATFPKADRHSVVIFQVTEMHEDGSAQVTYQQVEATDSSAIPTTFSGYDSSIANLYVAVNDAVGMYNDNSSENQYNTVTCTIALNN